MSKKSLGASDVERLENTVAAGGGVMLEIIVDGVGGGCCFTGDCGQSCDRSCNCGIASLAYDCCVSGACGGVSCPKTCLGSPV